MCPTHAVHASTRSPRTHRRRTLAVLALSVPATATASAAGHQGPPPTGKLVMTGDVGDYVEGVVDDPVHDPTLFSDRGTYYVASTGIANPDDPGGIFLRRSDRSPAGPWVSLGAIDLPAWTRDYGVAHLWAPHVVERGGTFHLHYAASSFRMNRSAVGLATTRTPGDLDSWVDHGPVLTSDAGDDWNAIDPDVHQAGGGSRSGRSGAASRCRNCGTWTPPWDPCGTWPATPRSRRTRSRTRRCSGTAGTGTSPRAGGGLLPRGRQHVRDRGGPLHEPHGPLR